MGGVQEEACEIYLQEPDQVNPTVNVRQNSQEEELAKLYLLILKNLNH